jgi:hypothetical protein
LLFVFCYAEKERFCSARKASAEKKREEDNRKEEEDNKRKKEEDSKRKEEEEPVNKGKCDIFGALDQRENINVPIGVRGVQTTSSVERRR